MKRLLPSTARRLALPLFALVTAACYADEPSTTDLGKRLFLTEATPPCAICHSLKHAGADGAVGPSLDELKPDAARVRKAVRNGIGQMPAFSSLTDQQVEALARYVEQATGTAQ
jgi:mono/diheme cytochrome c family protein